MNRAARPLYIRGRAAFSFSDARLWESARGLIEKNDTAFGKSSDFSLDNAAAMLYYVAE